ncbi:MAG: hypothetical protein ACRCUT_12015 [Spirochaetota bacterium]
MAVQKKNMKKAGSSSPKTAKKALKRSAVKKSVSSKKTAPKTAKKAAKTAKKAPLQSMSADKNAVSIVEMSGGSFIIVIGASRLFFSLDEMRALVKICHESPSEDQACARLFSWFSAGRGDVIKDVPIKSRNDQALLLICRYLVNHYAVKQD